MYGTIISARIKRARKLAGFSQKQLGIAAGMDEFVASARVNQYETGKHLPDYYTVVKIANALGLPPAYFYTDDDVLADIIIYYGHLGATERRKLLSLIQSFIRYHRQGMESDCKVALPE